MAARRRAIILRSSGHSVAEIRKHLSKENISISLQALFNLITKHHQTGKLLDLPCRARPRKLTQEMVDMFNKALSENDELIARQACNLLMEK